MNGNILSNIQDGSILIIRNGQPNKFKLSKSDGAYLCQYKESVTIIATALSSILGSEGYQFTYVIGTDTINTQAINSPMNKGDTVKFVTTMRNHAFLFLDGGPSVNPEIRVQVEGDYYSWDSLGVALNAGPSAPSVFFTNAGKSLGFLVGSHTTIYDIQTHASVTSNIAPYPNWLNVQKASVLNTYILDVEGKTVLKNGIAIQAFTLPIGYVLLYGLGISPDGKYIAVTLFDGSNYVITLFEGS